MSIDTGRTDAGFAGRASHAGRSCAKALRRFTLIAAPAPTPSLRNPWRSSACECVLFISPSAELFILGVCLGWASPCLSSVLVDSRDAGRLLLPAGGKDVLHVLLPFVPRVLPDLVVLLSVAVDGERHLPGTREHLRVLERDRIVDAIGAGRRPAFHHVERVAVEAAVRVDP